MPAVTAAIACDPSRFVRVLDALDAVAARPLADGSPLRAGVEAAAGLYAAKMQERFVSASEGDGTWQPLAKSTVAKKRRYSPGPERILWASGGLYRSLAVGGVGNIHDVLDDRVRYGTRAPTAALHHKGGGRLPARPILVVPDRERLVRCTAPIVAAWRETVRALCRTA